MSRRISLAHPARPSLAISIATPQRIVCPLLAFALGSFGIGTTE